MNDNKLLKMQRKHLTWKTGWTPTQVRVQCSRKLHIIQHVSHGRDGLRLLHHQEQIGGDSQEKVLGVLGSVVGLEKRNICRCFEIEYHYREWVKHQCSVDYKGMPRDLAKSAKLAETLKEKRQEAARRAKSDALWGNQRVLHTAKNLQKKVLALSFPRQSPWRFEEECSKSLKKYFFAFEGEVSPQNRVIIMAEDVSPMGETIVAYYAAKQWKNQTYYTSSWESILRVGTIKKVPYSGEPFKIRQEYERHQSDLRATIRGRWIEKGLRKKYASAPASVWVVNGGLS